jgi:hypothetical protein
MRNLIHILRAAAMFSLTISPALAQTRLAKPAKIRTFGVPQSYMPKLQHIDGYGAYEILCPDHLPAIRMDRPDGYLLSTIPTAQKLNLSSGLQLSLPALRTGLGPPPDHTLIGLKKQIDFRRFLTDPKLWPHAALNDITYELGRTYYSPDSYWFFGLAKSHGKVYLGVCWYSPAASDVHNTYGMVFRLDWNGQTLLPIPLRPILSVGESPTFLYPLRLETLPNGDLCLYENGRVLQLNQQGKWSSLPETALQKVPFTAKRVLYWRRNDWIVTGYKRQSGKLIKFHVFVKNAATDISQNVREYTWSVYAGTH